MPFAPRTVRSARKLASNVQYERILFSTKIVAGDVEYLESPMANPSAGEALLCCSYPKLAPGADVVVLDI